MSNEPTEETYGLTLDAAGQITITCPVPEDESQPITRGHILMIGLAMKLREEGWADTLIEKTSDMLTTLRDTAASAGELTKVD